MSTIPRRRSCPSRPPLSALVRGTSLWTSSAEPSGTGGTDSKVSPFPGWARPTGSKRGADSETNAGSLTGKSVVPLRASNMQKISMQTADRVKNFIDIRRASAFEEVDGLACEKAKPMPRRRRGERRRWAASNPSKKIGFSKRHLARPLEGSPV
jgi:hypothetical protein